jgi:hypothetical protein
MIAALARLVLPVLLLVVIPSVATAAQPVSASAADVAKYRKWIEAMKVSPRGPFHRLRWFCADGTILPPTPVGCAGHGGGIQHGEWSTETRALRAAGYEVGTVLASVDPSRFVGESADLEALGQILLERFLVEADQGWILREAVTYRGAFQVEDEEAAARKLIESLLADPAWRAPERFLLLRETARILPLEHDATTATSVRGLAVDIAKADKGFEPLRAKIHGRPDAGDAGRVRAHAAQSGKAAIATKYELLASQIDDLYAPRGAAVALEKLAAESRDPALGAEIRAWAAEILAGPQGTERLGLASRRLAMLRDRIHQETNASRGLTMLLASLAIEREAYAAANSLGLAVQRATRRQRAEWLLRGATGGYGIGLLTKRQLVSVQESVFRLAARRRTVALEAYREELRYLARIPGWAGANIGFSFGPAMTKLAELEPLVMTFPQDRLRGSPVLVVGIAIDSLTDDANEVANLQQEIFGVQAGGALRALNPGLSRGVLREADENSDLTRLDPRGIYLLPETVADLPPIAGILTRGEGSSLSHVQLLANNLGIPNVVVEDAAVAAVRSRLGRSVVLAVSPNGVVRLVDDGPWWDSVFNVTGAVITDDEVTIRPDLVKLDLATTRFVPLSRVRASDSGRICGPKGANLGELAFHFGGRIPSGFVIPFGVFREFVDQPMQPDGTSAFEWMKQEYRRIGEFPPESEARREYSRAFLRQVREWIVSTDPGPEFHDKLRAAMVESFGPAANTTGVFVRSDTNVEDLPGFTGAGLNQTIPNVIGIDAVARAVREVWASPFTERAYAWRQSHMAEPQYVFPAVVVQRSFSSEKSGVMVTADLESREPGWITVAASEGVGGVVDGQAAESLRINVLSGESRQLARATSPYRRLLTPDGGLVLARATGADSILTGGEILQLITLARDVEARFPGLVRPDGTRMPADVEFAFRAGQLALLQLRPFVDSKRARSNYYLAALEVGLRDNAQLPVDLDGVPGQPVSNVFAETTP